MAALVDLSRVSNAAWLSMYWSATKLATMTVALGGTGGSGGDGGIGGGAGEDGGDGGVGPGRI